MKDIRTTSTVELLELLDKPEIKKDQSLVNTLAYELTYRVYIPEGKQTFEEILYSFGYKKVEKQKNKVK